MSLSNHRHVDAFQRQDYYQEAPADFESKETLVLLKFVVYRDDP